MCTRVVLNLIFAKMTLTCKVAPTKPQRTFLGELFRVLFAMRGRATFANMARFSALHEQTFRRHFQKAFDWVAFNLSVLRLRRHPRERLVGVFDCTFLPKSSRKTYGLDRFFSSAASAARSGLEVSLLGVVALESRRAVALDATQTPAGLSAVKGSAQGYSVRYTRMDFYLEQVTDLLRRLDRQRAAPEVTYWVGNGNYARGKVFDALRAEGRHLITRLRSDANLRHLYSGPRKKGPGRPKTYDGKVRFDRLGTARLEGSKSKLEAVGALVDQPSVRLFTTAAYSPHFGRTLRVVVLQSQTTGDYLVLASSDPQQPADEVVACYRLRYQIELLICDAKQHGGLAHCQARSQAKLDFHLNMSMAALNLGRLMSRRAGLSMRSYAREAYNRFLAGRLLSELGLEAELVETHPGVRRVVQTGRVTW